MIVIGFYITEWAFILEKTKQNVYHLARNRLQKVSSLDIKYGEIHIKQYHTVTYFGCWLDKALSAKYVTLKVLNKISIRLRFLYIKDKFLPPPLCRLLCNSIMQPHFDYACSAWCPNLKKRLGSKLKINTPK